MSLASKEHTATSVKKSNVNSSELLREFVPLEVLPLKNPQTDIPRIAKDERLLHLIEEALQLIPTIHDLYLGDARHMNWLLPQSVQLVVTSPPYWTLKEYRDSEGQMGHIEDY